RDTNARQTHPRTSTTSRRHGARIRGVVGQKSGGCVHDRGSGSDSKFRVTLRNCRRTSCRSGRASQTREKLPIEARGANYRCEACVRACTLPKAKKMTDRGIEGIRPLQRSDRQIIAAAREFTAKYASELGEK